MSPIQTFMLILFVLTDQQTTSQPATAAGWFSTAPNYCYVQDDNLMNNPNANISCVSSNTGGRLVNFNDEDELITFTAYQKMNGNNQNNFFWTGLSTCSSGGEYCWKDGSVLSTQLLKDLDYLDLNGTTGCVAMTNGIEAGNRTVLLVEEECSKLLPFYCKVPCTVGPAMPTVVSDSPAPMVAGSLVNLICLNNSVLDSTPIYTWYRNGIIIVGEVSSTLSTTSLSQVAINYTCAITSDGKTSSTSYNPVEHVYKYLPAILVQPRELNDFSSGTPVTLTCSLLTPSTDPNYTWFRSDSGVQTTLGETTGSIIVDAASLPSSTNEFSCTFSSGAIQSYNSTARKINFISGPGMPTITSDSPAYVEVNIAVLLSCVNTTELMGPPSYLWMMDGQILAGETVETLSTSSSTPGLTNYSCAVTDQLGQSTFSMDYLQEYKISTVYNHTDITKQFCYLIKQSLVTKTDAETSCQNNGVGSHLLKPYTNKELDYLKNLLNSIQRDPFQYWIAVAGTYIWGDGTTISVWAWKYSNNLKYSGLVNLYNPYRKWPSFGLLEVTDSSIQAGVICKYPCQSSALSLLSSNGVRMDPSQANSLSCSASYVTAQYQFYKNDIPFALVTSPSISVAAPNQNIKMGFVCASVGVNGEYSIISDHVNITYIETPIITAIPIDTHEPNSFSIGTNVTLTCVTTLIFTNPTYMWTNSDSFGTKNFIGQIGRQMSVMYSDLLSATNVIRCTVIDAVLGASQAAVYPLTYRVGPPRPIVTSLDPGAVDAKTFVTLTCVVAAGPAPTTVMWYINDVLDPTITTATFKTTSQWPRIISYACRAVDTTGKSTISDPYSVQYKLPDVYTFTAANYFCYTLFSGVKVNKDDATYQCTTLGPDISLANFYTWSEFDILSKKMMQVQIAVTDYWVNSVVLNNSYCWGDNSLVSMSDFTDTLSNPLTTCVTISNYLNTGKYQLREKLYGCDDALGYLCHVPCNKESDGPAIDLIVSTRSYLLNVGTELNITCSVGFPAKEFKWYFDGVLFETSNTSVKKFASPSQTQGRNYSCSAVGQAGELAVSDIHTVFYIEKPYIIISPIPSLSEYSSGTIVTLTCATIAALTAVQFIWFKDDVLLPDMNSRNLMVNQSLIDTVVSNNYTCRFQIKEGNSSLATKQPLTFTPGPGMPLLDSNFNSWVWASVWVNFYCRNVTVLEGPPVYHWFVNNVKVDNENSAKFVNTSMSPMNRWNYHCKISDGKGLSTQSFTQTLLYTVQDMCTPNPCENNGMCYAVSYNESACKCDPGFEGRFCERVIIMVIANSFNTGVEQNSIVAVEDILTGMSRDLMVNMTNATISRISLSSEAIVVYSQRLLAEGAHLTWNKDTFGSMTQKTIEKSHEIIDRMKDINCTELGDVPMCRKDNVEQVFKNLKNSIFSMGAATIKAASGTSYLNTLRESNTTMTLSRFNKNLNRTFQTAGAKVNVPRSMDEQIQDKVMIVAVKYDVDPYFHRNTSLTPDENVFSFRLKNDQGQDLLINPEDPVTMAIDPLVKPVDHVLMNLTSEGIHVIPLTDFQNAAIGVEMGVSATQILTIKGQVDVKPSDIEYEFYIEVDNLRRLIVYNNTNYTFTLAGDILTIFSANVNGTTLYLMYFYNDTTIVSGGHVETFIVAYGIFVNYWDSKNICWQQAKSNSEAETFIGRKLLSINGGNTSIQITNVDQAGRVVFSSNMFGSFSLSRFIIPPNIINFDHIFSDFWTSLEDSPYVLALNLILLFLTINLALLLRRFDHFDKILWTYLSLVDNVERDEYMYTISVHTALGSPKTMTCTPYFVITGSQAVTRIRVLSDGTRQNFAGGTVSNFVLKSPVWLGDLFSIKLWTDGRGDQPDWLLDRLVIVDLTEDKNYVFVCQEWFALTRGIGKLCFSIPVTRMDIIAGTSGFSLISKQKLYDQHLWLSVAKRPNYSTFTRVQRFLCAIALLFLTMITNAMFYNKDDTSDKSSGVKFGPFEIGYRDVYVGVVSAVIVIIPGFLMTWIFTHRKVKGVNYNKGTNKFDPYRVLGPNTGDNAATFEKHPFASSTQTSSAIFNAPDQLNTSIKFLRSVMEDFHRYQHLKENKSEDEILEENVDKTHNIGHDFSHSEGSLAAKEPSLLPWWFVCVGYFLVVASILTSAALTFFYSLDWGGKVSLHWMLSLVFSTSASALAIEPVKILLLCLLLSCIFRQFAVKDLCVVAPFDKDTDLPAPSGPIPPIVKEPDTNTKDMVKKKEELKLRQKLMHVMRGLGFQVVMVILVASVCLSAQITKSSQENHQIRSSLGLTFLSSVHKKMDIYTWLQQYLIPNVMPTNNVNSQPLTTYERKFLKDGEHYRIGPIRIMQYRVQGNLDCETRNSLSGYLHDIHCLGNYDLTHRESGNFDKNWTICQGSCALNEFKFTASDPFSLSQSGELTWYGPGGYQAILSNSQAQALTTLSNLQSIGWIDNWTRGLLIEFTVFNPNTRLFTQAKVLLETPSMGNTVKNIEVASARLYPYTTVWDYLILLFQLIFAAVVLFRLFLTVSLLVKPAQGTSRCSWDTLFALLELLTALTAFVTFIVKVQQTGILLERILNNSSEFSSFDVVFLLDEIYTVTMSTVLFIRILECLKPLTLNYHLFLLRQTLKAAIPQLRGFAAVLVISLLAFSMYFSIARGPYTRSLRNTVNAFSYLLTILLGHGRYVDGEDEMAEQTGFSEAMSRIMFGLFSLGSAIILLNLAITILNTYMSDVKTLKSGNKGQYPGFDDKLNQFMWARLEAWIAGVFQNIARVKDKAVSRTTEKGQRNSKVVPFVDITECEDKIACEDAAGRDDMRPCDISISSDASTQRDVSIPSDDRTPSDESTPSDVTVPTEINTFCSSAPTENMSSQSPGEKCSPYQETPPSELFSNKKITPPTRIPPLARITRPVRITNPGRITSL